MPKKSYKKALIFGILPLGRKILQMLLRVWIS